jgi:hypothetical protein
MKARDTAERDVDRACRSTSRSDRLLRAPVAASRDAGEHPLQHRPRQRITVGEVLVGRQLHLRAAVGTPHPRPLDRDPAATERHLARLVAVTHRCPLRNVLALRAHNLDDLFLEQLGQHPEPNADAQGEQPLLRRPHQLAKRLLHPRRQRQLLVSDLLQRYGLHGGSSCLTTTSTTRHGRRATGRDGRTATSNFYDERDNLRSTIAWASVRECPPTAAAKR